VDLRQYNDLLAALDPTIVTLDVGQDQPTSVLYQPGEIIRDVASVGFHDPPRALALAVSCGTIGKAPEAEIDASIGIALTRWSYYDRALSHFERALHSIQNESALLIVEWHRMLCVRRLSGLSNAHASFLQVASKLEESGYHQEAVRCRIDAIADIHLARREEEISELRSVLGTGDLRSEQPEQGILDILCAGTFIQQGNYAKAQNYIEHAEALFRTCEMPMMLAFAWLYRAISRRGTRSARYWLNKALQYSRGLQHSYFAALCMMEIVIQEYECGRITRAKDLHQQLSDLAETNKLIQLATASEIQIANIRYRQGALREAEEGYKQALKFSQQTGDRYSAAVATLNLGVIAQHDADFSRALYLFGRARPVFESYKAIDLCGTVSLNQGEIYAGLGHFEPAIEQLETSARLFEDLGLHHMAVRPLLVLARVLMQAGDFTQAKSILTDVLSRTGKRMLLERAQCRALEGNLLSRQGQTAEALIAYKASLRLFEKLGQDRAREIVRLEISQCHLQMGDKALARTTLNNIRAELLPGNLRWLYKSARAETAQDTAGMLREYYGALYQIGRTKRTLNDKVAAEHLILSAQSAIERAIETAIESGAVHDALQLAELTSQDYAKGFPFRGVHSQRFVRTLQRSLDKAINGPWLLLRYLWQKDSLCLFALSPNGLALHKIPLPDLVQLMLKAATASQVTVRKQIYSDNSFQRTLDVLGETLIPLQIRQALTPDTRLIVVPSRQLFGLPFHALSVNEGTLINLCYVTYAHSLAEVMTLANKEERVSAQVKRGLVLAQAHFSTPEYRDLPAVEAEADWLAHSFSEAVDRVDPAKSEAQDKALFINDGHYEWIHIGTHTYVDPATGYSSGLVFGNSIITASEIQEWGLTAEWVTLSACQTGVARWYFGDETAGLARAFLAAGAKSVIASFWQVEDEAASELIRAYYDQIKAGDGPVKALAIAQRDALNRKEGPYRWAAYGLYGLPG
jgi:CHAT domain-containing protein/predicted negative regulator of RcsB-dependent stress response